MTPTYLLGVILPLVTGFYLLLSLLEDTGYLPRIAALTDRSLTAMGLNGRAVIPLILGLGCVTMGTLTTRILGSKRERFIATALMAIAVPCSAQIAVIAALMAQDRRRLRGAPTSAILFAIFVALGTVLQPHRAGAVDRPAHRPAVAAPAAARQRRAQERRQGLGLHEGGHALLPRRAPLFISVLQVTGALDVDHPRRRAAHRRAGSGCRRRPPTAFVMGFVRRDFGAAGFFTMNLTDRAAARRDGDDHAVRAVHREHDGRAQGARLAVT